MADPDEEDSGGFWSEVFGVLGSIFERDADEEEEK